MKKSICLLFFFMTSALATGEPKERREDPLLINSSIPSDTVRILGNILRVDEPRVSDLLSMRDMQARALPNASRFAVNVFLAENRLQISLEPFEIERYRSSGEIPPPSLKSNLDRLKISPRSRNALSRMGATEIGEVVKFTEAQLDASSLIGLKASLKRALESFRLSSGRTGPKQGPFLTQTSRRILAAQLTAEARKERIETKSREKEAKRQRVADLRLEKIATPKEKPKSVKEVFENLPELTSISAAKNSAVSASEAKSRLRTAPQSPKTTMRNSRFGDDLSQDTAEILAANGIFDAQALHRKSLRWLEDLFPVDVDALDSESPDRISLMNLDRLSRIEKFLVKKFGYVYKDDLEAAISRREMTAKLVPSMMNISADLLAELGEKVVTVRNLLDRVEEMSRDDGYLNRSAEFRRLRLRLEIVQKSCEARLIVKTPFPRLGKPRW